MAAIATYLIVGGFIGLMSLFALMILLPIAIAVVLYPLAWMGAVFLNIKQN